MDYQYLAGKDQKGHEQESFAFEQVVECTPVTAVSFRVKHVPELQEHEDGKKEGEVAHPDGCGGVDPPPIVGKKIKQAEQDGHESGTRTQDKASHPGNEDKSVGVSRLPFHNLLARGQRGQSSGGKRVHDEVNPKHLRHG